MGLLTDVVDLINQTEIKKCNNTSIFFSNRPE